LLGTLKSLLVLAEPGDVVTPADLPEFMRRPLPTDNMVGIDRSRPVCRLDAVAEETMQAALDACGGNVSEAARRLGISRSTLYRHRRRPC
jgi:transcriptional regulator of acetoin/glycerol metabolism